MLAPLHQDAFRAKASPAALAQEIISPDRLETLETIQRRVLWLATLIVHHANHVRPNPEGTKVGGHQASSASMVSIMTALYFHFLQAGATAPRPTEPVEKSTGSGSLVRLG